MPTKVSLAGRQNQHARRVRYQDVGSRAFGGIRDPRMSLAAIGGGGKGSGERRLPACCFRQPAENKLTSAPR
jgi:hypothetical protein